MNLLKSRDEEIKSEVVIVLDQMDSKAVPALLELLKQEDLQIRRTAAWTIAHIIGPESKSVAPTLTQLINHEDRTIRLTAALAYWKVSSMQRRPYLLS